MVCPPATSEAGARWPRFGLVVATTTSRRDNKDQMIRPLIFHEAPCTVAQLYGLPHGILHVFNTILYENEFQNPQIFQQTISLFPEQSTLVLRQ
jgi:hypothetical protein